MDLRTGDGQIDLHHERRAAAMAAARAFDRHVTSGDPLAITLQPLAELARARLERARMIGVAKCQGDG